MAYVSSSYECPTSLAFSDIPLSSNERGSAAGRPIRTFALEKALKLPKCDMVVAYLDDVVLGMIEALGVTTKVFCSTIGY